MVKVVKAGFFLFSSHRRIYIYIISSTQTAKFLKFRAAQAEAETKAQAENEAMFETAIPLRALCTGLISNAYLTHFRANQKSRCLFGEIPEEEIFFPRSGTKYSLLVDPFTVRSLKS